MLHSTVVYVFECQTKNPWSEFGRANKFSLKYIWWKNLPNQQCSNPLWIREWLKVAFPPFWVTLWSTHHTSKCWSCTWAVGTRWAQLLCSSMKCGAHLGSAPVTKQKDISIIFLNYDCTQSLISKKKITNISRGTECALHFSTFLGNMGHSQLPTVPSHGPLSVVFAVTVFCCGKFIYENNLCKCYLSSSPQFLHFKDEKNPSFNILNKTVRNISHITDSSGFHLSVNVYNCTV